MKEKDPEWIMLCPASTPVVWGIARVYVGTREPAGRMRRRKGQNNRAQYPKQVTLFAANQLCYSLIAYIEQKNGL